MAQESLEHRLMFEEMVDLYLFLGKILLTNQSLCSGGGKIIKATSAFVLSLKIGN